jgi:calcineurin-like phosphoesterase family protein
MRWFLHLLSTVLLAVGLSCAPPVETTPPPADAPAAELALTGASVLIGTGDIGNCGNTGNQGAKATAKLMDSVLRADSAAKVHDEAFTLGDNAYPGGSVQDFAECFATTWGDSSKLIMKNIRPAVGNHEHTAGMAAPYYKYFGSHAGPSDKGYYSYTVGEWHAIVLNSEIVVNSGFTDTERAAQEEWLRQDLKSNQKLCTLAYWHHPRFSSGWHGSDSRLAPFWQILYEAGVDLVLNGHDHEYERFLPLTPQGVVDSTKGITQIVVGTGGGDLRGFRNPLAPHSAYRVQGHYGVLKLTLGAKAYQRAFLGVNGSIWDRGGAACH